MALIECNNCGHMISDKARRCPKCGMEIRKIAYRNDIPKPIPDNVGVDEDLDEKEYTPCQSEKSGLNKRLHYIIIGVVVLIAVVIAFAALNSQETAQTSTKDNAVEKTAVAEESDSECMQADSDEAIGESETDEVAEEMDSQDTETDGDEGGSEPTEQDELEADATDEVADGGDEPLQFVDGLDAMHAYIAQHIKYPPIAAESGIEGKVVVEALIDEKGNVCDVRVLRSPDKSLSDEAVRVVKSLPNFIPKKENGVFVRETIQIPVMFRLM